MEKQKPWFYHFEASTESFVPKWHKCSFSPSLGYQIPPLSPCQVPEEAQKQQQWQRSGPEPGWCETPCKCLQTLYYLLHSVTHFLVTWHQHSPAFLHLYHYLYQVRTAFCFTWPQRIQGVGLWWKIFFMITALQFQFQRFPDERQWLLNKLKIVI